MKKQKNKALQKMLQPRSPVNQKDACVNVVADIQAMIDENDVNEFEVDDIMRIIRERGVSPTFIGGILVQRKSSAEKEKEKAIASLRAAYKKLPQSQKDILDKMNGEDLLDSICDMDKE